MRTRALRLALALLPLSTVDAQDTAAVERIGGNYYGPRLGVTYLSSAVTREMKSNSVKTASLISQFGWQWEQRFVVAPDAPMFVSELVLLVGGAEQGVFLPSLTWLIGVRVVGGGEFGLGPNVSLAGAGVAIGAGITSHAGQVNIPFNVAAVIGKPGLRVSVLTGFNMKR